MSPAAREAELRRLRKMNTEFEEQNAILQKHTESMNCAKEKLEQELAQEERQTLALQQQLQSVRQALTSSFASLPIPGELGAAPGTNLAVLGHGGHVEGAEASGGCSRDVSGVVITACLVGGGSQSIWGSPESPDVPGSSSIAGQDKLGTVLVPRCSHSFLRGGVGKRNNPFVPGFVWVGAQCCRTLFRVSSPARCTRLGGDLPSCCPVGTGETPTLSTLDFYMAKLHSAIESNPLQHEKLVVRIKEILSRIAR